MTYIHFELLLIFVNKYRTRDVYRVRESRDLFLEAEREVPYSGTVSLYL